MKKYKILTAIATASIPLSLLATSCSQNAERTLDVYRDINLDDDWTFKLNDGETQNINLPHDFSIIQNFKHTNRDLRHQQTSGTTGFLPGGIGYYHKDFVLPKKPNASVILDFDGAYNDTLVSVNGHLVGNNRYGYNPFAFDISNYVTADGQTVNKLDVIVKHKYVTSSRWYPGSGIYRDVKVSVVDKVHVAHNGTYVTTPYLKQEVGKDATVNVEVDVQNSYDDAQKISVQNRVVDANGNPVSDWVESDVQSIQSNETNTFTTTLKVNKPKLWSDKTPNLYYVETQVLAGLSVVDQYKTRFGFRYFEFDREGFKVNGQVTKLFGVCLHHDQGALGAAAYNDAIHRQLVIMKEMGMNAIRTSHNCPDEDLLRMCDELGLYVMDEAFDGWEFSKTSHDFGETWKDEIGYGNNLIDAKPDMQWHSFVLQSMVKRDRNCPSIFMWSLGNELHEGAWHDTDITDDERARIGEEMLNYAKELKGIAETYDHDSKTKRWCGIALEQDPLDPDKTDWPKCQIGMHLYNEGGLLGFNYGSAFQTQRALEQFDRVYGSETASANNSRGMYGNIAFDKNEEHHRVPSYDVSGTTVASEVIWRTLHFDGYGGQFVWTGFDYIGEPSPWCWNCEEDPVSDVTWPYPNSAYYGIVDTCGFPKDSYYLYRAHQRHDDTTLHLVGSLNTANMYIYPKAAKYVGFTPVDVYTNAPHVLIKDGEHELAEITRTPALTSNKVSSYYTYQAVSKDAEKCVVDVPKSRADLIHGLYSDILIKPDLVNEIHAEAYDEDMEPITDTIGLDQLETVDKTFLKFDAKADKETLSADGKSLSYITIDLKDAKGNILTDYDSQKEFNISWSGTGDVLGVDNGDQESHEKFQSPDVYRINGENKAKIKTYAGKALIIVGSSKTAGEIKVTISCDGFDSQTITIRTE